MGPLLTTIMSNTEINSKKLEALHKYLQNGGSTELKDVQNQLKVSSEPIVQEYKAALIAQWPEVYDKPAEDVDDDGLGEEGSLEPLEEVLPGNFEVSEDALGQLTEPVEDPEESRTPEELDALKPVAVSPTTPRAKKVAVPATVAKAFWLKNEDGSAVELSVSNETPSKIILQPKFLKDA